MLRQLQGGRGGIEKVLLLDSSQAMLDRVKQHVEVWNAMLLTIAQTGSCGWSGSWTFVCNLFDITRTTFALISRVQIKHSLPARLEFNVASSNLDHVSLLRQH